MYAIRSYYVLVTHGRLAVELIAALEHVVGHQERILAVCIGPDDDMEQRRQDIMDSVAAVDDGSGAVVLTDMFGGTPRITSYNVCYTKLLRIRQGNHLGASGRIS